MRDDKRRQREEKRAIKREGTKRARRALARNLRENPDEAEFDEVDFGRARSSVLNGQPRAKVSDEWPTKTSEHSPEPPTAEEPPSG